jgi:hypothetical protein
VVGVFFFGFRLFFPAVGRAAGRKFQKRNISADTALIALTENRPTQV